MVVEDFGDLGHSFCWLLSRLCLQRKIPKQLWTNDAEKALLVLWGELVSSAQGKMMTRQEKLDTVQARLNEKSAEENWQIEFTSEQTSNKLDTWTKKAKKHTKS